MTLFKVLYFPRHVSPAKRRWVHTHVVLSKIAFTLNPSQVSLGNDVKQTIQFGTNQYVPIQDKPRDNSFMGWQGGQLKPVVNQHLTTIRTIDAPYTFNPCATCMFYYASWGNINTIVPQCSNHVYTVPANPCNHHVCFTGQNEILKPHKLKTCV